MNFSKCQQGQINVVKLSGFTLVEMLVTMVLLGLISSILFQGLNLVGKIQQSVVPKIQQQQRLALQEKWFRESVSGLMAGVKNNEMFRGTDLTFSGLSISPLHSQNSAPALISWNIVDNAVESSLYYHQLNSFNWQIKSYPDPQSSLEFTYLNLQGDWQKSWNIRGSNIDQLVLPQAIALKSISDGKEHWWIASIDGEKQASWWLTDNE